MASSNPVTFSKTVAAAATAEVLVAARTEVRNATIQAKPGNTGTVSFRDAVGGADSNTLNAGDIFAISAEAHDTFDLESLFVKVSVNGEGVDVFYEN